MSAETLVLEDRRVGEAKTLTLATNIAAGDNAGAPKNPTSGSTFLVFDPDRETRGAATAVGGTTALTDTARAEADDFWNGLTLVLTDATDGTEYRTEVTDFVQATHTLTFNAIPVAVATGDTYRIEGYPLLPETAATVSVNKGSVQLTPADALGTPGRRVLIYRADFGSDTEKAICTFRVLPATA